MFHRIALLMIMVAAVTSGALAQRVQGVTLLTYGVFEPKSEGKVTELKDHATKQRVDYTKVIIRNKSSKIIVPEVAEDKIVFGARFLLLGKRKGQVARIKVVWLYPEPGMTNPDTGVTKLTDAYYQNWKIGDEFNFYWTTTSDWTRVPGTWTLQLWLEDRLLGEKSFQMIRQG